ncbi:thermonuclease family protein [Paenibacillus plantarum]|uniref:thermonuclease family protein n=1 Tax=Paenibacillus plantarum TaxID=2654975 RepID=UPI001492C050|nr:thermonuclease family protein [Paenibacillus plantarum]
MSIGIVGLRDRNKHLHINVYLQDGILLNEKLVEEGYAATSLDLQNDGLASTLNPLQADAIQKNKGLWASKQLLRLLHYIISTFIRPMLWS